MNFKNRVLAKYSVISSDKLTPKDNEYATDAETNGDEDDTEAQKFFVPLPRTDKPREG